jgi:hypothetical protein
MTAVSLGEIRQRADVTFGRGQDHAQLADQARMILFQVLDLSRDGFANVLLEGEHVGDVAADDFGGVGRHDSASVGVRTAVTPNAGDRVAKVGRWRRHDHLPLVHACGTPSEHRLHGGRRRDPMSRPAVPMRMLIVST